MFHKEITVFRFPVTASVGPVAVGSDIFISLWLFHIRTIGSHIYFCLLINDVPLPHLPLRLEPLGNLISHRRNKTPRFPGAPKILNHCKGDQSAARCAAADSFSQVGGVLGKYSNTRTPSLRWGGPCAFKQSAAHTHPASSWSCVEHHPCVQQLFFFFFF